MPAGDIVNCDAVVLALDALTASDRLVALLGGPNIGGEVEPPYPRIVVRPTGGVITDNLWRVTQDISVSAVGDRPRVPGDVVLSQMVSVAALVLMRLPNIEVVDPTQVVVSEVVNTVGPQSIDTVGSRPRWAAYFRFTMRPPTVAPASP